LQVDRARIELAPASESEHTRGNAPSERLAAVLHYTTGPKQKQKIADQKSKVGDLSQ